MRHLIGSISILVLTAALLTGAVVAQEASPAASSTVIPAPLAGWVAAWEAQSLEAAPIAAAYTEDAVYEEVATAVSLRSREEIETYLTGFFAAFSDARADVETAFATEDQAAATWSFTGRYTNQLPGFPPPAGQAVMFRGASILELREGMIERETQYWDVYGILAQLGAVPDAASAAPGTPTA
jgi:steroid delta-isomerase-like uncharacterized protein